MTIEAPPPRDSWPDPPAQTEAGEVLTDLIIGTFRLNAGCWTSPRNWPAPAG